MREGRQQIGQRFSRTGWGNQQVVGMVGALRGGSGLNERRCDKTQRLEGGGELWKESGKGSLVWNGTSQ